MELPDGKSVSLKGANLLASPDIDVVSMGPNSLEHATALKAKGNDFVANGNNAAAVQSYSQALGASRPPRFNLTG